MIICFIMSDKYGNFALKKEAKENGIAKRKDGKRTLLGSHE